MNVSAETGKLLEEAVMLAEQNHHEYVTPEHLLYALTLHDIFVKAFRNCGGSIDRLKKHIEEYFNENLEKVGEGEIKLTTGFEQVLMQAEGRAAASERITVDILHIVCGLFELEESYAQYFMEEQGVGAADLLYEMCEYSAEEDFGAGLLEDFEDLDFEESYQAKGKNWRQFVQCMNDFCMEKNPLIGREDELERTMQILCRKDKNNPLHIGEPGVGKTAIAYELARRLEEKKVPDLLLGAKVYAVDLGGMLAGILIALIVLLCCIAGGMSYIGIGKDINFGFQFLVLGGFLIQGAAEEILCRGFLMSSLLKKVSAPWAIFISSTMFMLPHLASMEAEPVFKILGIVNLYLVSILFSLLILCRSNIWISCGLHSVWNFILYGVLGLTLSGGEANTTGFLCFEVNGSNLINGGIYGVEASIITTAIIGITVVVCYGGWKKKYDSTCDS